MNRLTRTLPVLSFTIFVVVLSYPVFAGLDTETRVNKTLVMEVAVADRPTFIMPVNDDKSIAVVPMRGSTASAVKIIPTVKGNLLQFELQAVVDKLPDKLSCDTIKTLKTEQVTSYSAGEGKVIRVSDFEKFGIAPFTIRVMPFQTERLCPNGACCCGVNTCYPNPGSCIECGSCGNCCRVQ